MSLQALTHAMKEFRITHMPNGIQSYYSDLVPQYNEIMEFYYTNLPKYLSPDNFQIHFDGSISATDEDMYSFNAKRLPMHLDLSDRNVLWDSSTIAGAYDLCFSLFSTVSFSHTHQIQANLDSLTKIQVPFGFDFGMPISLLYLFNPELQEFYSEFISHWLVSDTVEYQEDLTAKNRGLYPAQDSVYQVKFCPDTILCTIPTSPKYPNIYMVRTQNSLTVPDIIFLYMGQILNFIRFVQQQTMVTKELK